MKRGRSTVVVAALIAVAVVAVVGGTAMAEEDVAVDAATGPDSVDDELLDGIDEGLVEPNDGAGPSERSVGSVAPGSSTGSSLADRPPSHADRPALDGQRYQRADAGTQVGGAVDEEAPSWIHHAQTIEQTEDRPGSYDAVSRYELPESVTSLQVTLPEQATVLETDGFVPQSDRQFAWDGRTESPSIRMRMPANRTTDRDDPFAGPGDYIFVDTGEWGIVQRPQLGHSWGWRGGPRIGLHQTLDADPGVAGDSVAYLGEYEEHTHEAHGQLFRLVVPERADLAENPDDVLEELAYASDALRVGDRDEEVFVVAAPTAGIQWGVRGLQTGPADMWVRDFERLEDPESVWLHEYIHTRQDYRTAPDARWFSEASASYYAALLALERDRIWFGSFRERLALGEASPRSDGSVLSDPATWRNHPDYTVGALAAAELDRTIRLESGGERTLQDVFRAMNEAPDVVAGDDLRRFVEDAGGAAGVDAYDAYVTTTERPTMWSLAEHGEAFGTPPARIGYDVVSEGPIHVSGDYRDRRLDGDVLVPGERITIEVEATNAGGTAGDFEVTLRVGDAELDRADGRLDPGASTTVTLSGTVEELGRQDVRIADRRFPLEVRQPAEARVTGLEADRTTVERGEPLTVRTTVANGEAWPAEREVVLVSGDADLDEQLVRLDAGENRTVESTVRFDEPGEYELSVRGSEATITVVVEEDVESRSTAAIVALVAAAVVALVAIAVAAFIARSRTGDSDG